MASLLGPLWVPPPRLSGASDFPGSRPYPVDCFSGTPTPRRLVASLYSLASSSAHYPSGPAPGPRPQGHTLNSAMVRLRLYRFSERKLLRELLMKTVTVGAEIPVTSISPRSVVARDPVQQPHTGSAVAAAASGISVPPLVPKQTNTSAPTNTTGQSLSSFLHLQAESRAGPANPERASMPLGSSNSCTGSRPGGREDEDAKKKDWLELAWFAMSKLGACA